MEGRVVDHDERPLAEVTVRVYQTDARGYYTPERPMDEPNARLSGTLRTDRQGRFRIETVRPGPYPDSVRLGGRDRQIPAHIHLDLAPPGYQPRKLQAVFADDPLLQDPYWAAWRERFDHPLLQPRTDGDRQQVTLQIEVRLRSDQKPP